MSTVRIPKLKPDPDAKKPKISDEKPKLSADAEELLKNFKKLDSIDKFYKLEDKIAADLEHEKIYEQFLEQTTGLKQMLKEYIEGKKIESNVISKMANVKRLARLCHYATSKLRQETSDKLDIVDAKVLQLQNTTSEVQHIQKEIDRCLDFSAGDEELDLISVEEFYKNAPETISEPEKTKEDEHLRYLARLKFEAVQRTEMLQALNESEGRRNVLASNLRGKEQKLQSLKPKIESLIKASEPIQDILGQSYKEVSVELQQKQLAVQLPSPLAVIHSNSIAYKEISNDKNFDVKIVENEENSKKTKEEIGEEESTLFEIHPKNVELNIECPEQEINISMKFYHFVQLKVTTLKWTVQKSGRNLKHSQKFLNEDGLLSNLVDEDEEKNGISTTAEIKMGNLRNKFNSHSKNVGKTYGFVQNLTGEGEALITGAQFFEYLKKIVKSVRERVEERLKLEKEVKNLESKKSDVLESAEAPDVKLTQFKLCDDEVFMAAIPTSLSEYLAESTIRERFSFKAEFEHLKQKNKINVFISIPANYPKSSARIGLVCTGVEEKLKELETRINEQQEKLTNQLRTLVEGFDAIFVENIETDA